MEDRNNHEDESWRIKPMNLNVRQRFMGRGPCKRKRIGEERQQQASILEIIMKGSIIIIIIIMAQSCIRQLE